MTRVEFRDVTVRIGRRTVLDSIDTVAPDGAFTALIGPNGSGKSTLLGTLSGTPHRVQGRVLLDGVDVLRMRPAHRAALVGVLPQDEPTTVELTVGELVELGIPAAVRSRSPRRQVLDALERTGASPLIDLPVAALSGGERQRVLLARAVVGSGGVLALDEPTNHLDPKHQFHALELAARSGRTVIAALHTLDLAVRYADHVIVLSEGRVVVTGAPATVLSSAVLREVFGVDGSLVTDPTPHLFLAPERP